MDEHNTICSYCGKSIKRYGAWRSITGFYYFCSKRCKGLFERETDELSR